MRSDNKGERWGRSIEHPVKPDAEYVHAEGPEINSQADAKPLVDPTLVVRTMEEAT